MQASNCIGRKKYLKIFNLYIGIKIRNFDGHQVFNFLHNSCTLYSAQCALIYEDDFKNEFLIFFSSEFQYEKFSSFFVVDDLKFKF